MTSRRRGVGVSLVAGTLAVSLTVPGCTLVGLGIGALVDHEKPPKRKPVVGPEVETLEPGTSLEVGTRDGHTVSGRYGGLVWARPEEYGPRYATARQALAGEAALPALGAGARVAVTSGSLATGGYLGLGPGFVSFQPADRREPSRVDLDHVVSLTDAEGRTIAGERLRTLVSSGRVPLLAGLLVEQAGGKQVVPFEDVTTVGRVVKSNKGKKTGLLVGVAVDVALVVASLVILSSWDDSGSSCRCRAGDPNCSCASCPLIESFDGRGYVLDAEPLGGATYEAAQRADTARLDRLVETDGEYRLRLRNEQSEIDHVDALALRVVDHAAGAEVVPDDRGRLHAVTGLLPPARGRDLRGARVEARLATSDGDLWLGNPYLRRSEVEADLRDGVELEYPRPADARAATLVVRAGATVLGPRMLAATLALHGRELPAFYARLNGDPAARTAFEEAREREVLPAVRVWDGGGWRIAGHVRDLPSLLMRDQAMPLDLAGLPAGPLRVRIDGPPGLWALDRVAVAWSGGSPAEAVHETRVLLERAVGEDGRDLTAMLRHADGQRHTLHPGRDRATLVFAAPPPRPGFTRSVLVEATGYYELIMPAEGEPQRAAFRRLVDEPGAVARFVLGSLRDDVRAATAGGRF
jgi:hypothetical protein